MSARTTSCLVYLEHESLSVKSCFDISIVIALLLQVTDAQVVLPASNSAGNPTYLISPSTILSV